MSFVNSLLASGLLPDSMIRTGICKRLAATIAKHPGPSREAQLAAVKAHADGLRQMPLAVHTEEANEQHYELPPAFFLRCLGPRLKYSSCLFEEPGDTLETAEERMLALTCERAELVDGQQVLELGCGWGSLSLWMAEHYPHSEFVVVSNSAPQKQFIDQRAQERGIANLTVRTANMVSYEGEGFERFDRVVSVEMFEHMKNYALLLERVASWLKPGGKLFVHIFTHHAIPYHYVAETEDDWMSRYFFTGGQMPSDDLFHHFQDHLKIEEQWKVNGTHYQKTAEAWLKNMDAHRDEIFPLFKETYGSDAAGKWWNYWRIFYMACAELWGYRDGEEWMVSHYRFRK